MNRGGLFGNGSISAAAKVAPNKIVKPINRNRKAIVSQRKKLAGIITAFLGEQPAIVAKQVTDAISATSKADEPDPELVQRILDELNLTDWNALAEEARTAILAAVKAGVTAGFTQIGFDGSGITDQVNEIALEWAKARSAELVGMKYNAVDDLITNPNAEWAITDSTREMLRADVSTAIEEGLSTDDLAQALSARYAFSDDRAQVIARTEIANADVHGNLIAYKQSGVVGGKEWILGSEHVDSDECDDAAELGVVGLDDDFGGVGDPPAHPNCTCDILPVLASDDDSSG